jgi:putative DNA primase/helicase
MKTAGKSTLCFTFLATISIGGPWPDGTSAEPGDVLVWSGEDDFEDTILPRFLMAGGDPLRIFPVHHVIDGVGKRAFDPGEDLPTLYEAAKRLPNPMALMIDPIVMAVPAGNDSHKNTETRRGLQPLVNFTVDLNIATIGVTHFTKGTADQNPIDRVTGSLAFGAIPRVVLAAAADAEDKQRRLVRIASNIGPSGGGFEFLLTQEPLDGFDFSAQRVRWGGHLQGPAKDLLEMKHQTEVMRAAQFLLDQLAGNDPVPVKELQDAARAHGVGTWRTVERAKENLPIKARKTGKIWCWELTKPRQRGPQ